MNVPTQLLYSQTTRHVLAATTMAAPPAGDVSAKAIAGDFLPVRYRGDPGPAGYAQTVYVPLDELRIFSADNQAMEVGLAREWSIVTDSNGNKTPTPLGTVTATVVCSTTGITITLTAPTAAPLDVWARVQPAGVTDPAKLSSAGQSVPGKTPAVQAGAQATVTLPLVGLVTGKYYAALVLAAGFAPHLEVFQAA